MRNIRALLDNLIHAMIWRLSANIFNHRLHKKAIGVKLIRKGRKIEKNVVKKEKGVSSSDERISLSIKPSPSKQNESNQSIASSLSKD
jgi:hypothetical protein